MAAQTPPDDPDRDINFAQPDFTLVALPTTLRVPKFKSAFRVTHRFTRPLGDGSFGDLAWRFLRPRQRCADRPRVPVWNHARDTDRLPQDLGSDDPVFRPARSAWPRAADLPFTVSALATIDGTNNFRDSYSPALGAVISRTVREHAAFYLEPIWVNNSNLLPSEVINDNDSVLLGVGARIRVRPTVYLTLEGVPRVAGDDPGSTQIGFGLEKRSGGHMFQLVVRNGFGTTVGQLARGARDTDDWYLGFSISRKFY